MSSAPPDPVTQISKVFERIEELKKRPGGDPVVLYELETLELAVIRRLAPRGTTYRERAEHIAQEAMLIDPGDAGRGAKVTQPLRGILLALKHDYEHGYLASVEELIHAETFGDFLEMSTHLLNEGYKDPAAVLAGGVLEGHLRKLAGKHLTPSEGHPLKSAAAINDELARAGAYGRLDQKNVTGWLDLRNSAAHADWAKYNADQVDLLIRGVREFVARLPA